MANETFIWGFLDESPTDLQTMGWQLSNLGPSDIVQSNTYQYKPVGAPANYSLQMDHNDWASVPTIAQPSVAHGSMSAAVRVVPGSSLSNNFKIIEIKDIAGEDSIYATVSNTGAVNLYVDDAYKSTSAETYNWESWQFITVFYDFSSSTNKGKIEIGGVLSNAEETDLNTSSPTAPANIRHYIRGFSSTNVGTAHGAVIVREDYASAAPVRYVTVVQVDSDVSETGTWTPDTGTDNYARIDGPYDAASYTEEASPSASDKVVCGLTANLASNLGFAAGTIDAVCTIAVSTGAGQTGRAAVGDGSAVTNGDTTTIGASSTMTVAVAATSPSGPAWSSSDTPEAAYEVVTS